MVEVGVKQLKSELSAYLRRVARGETVRVTVRGRPVADVVPAARDDRDEAWRRLVAEGRVTPAREPLPSRPPPLEDFGRSASAEILAEREEVH